MPWWKFWRRPGGTALRFVLYTRQGCHLCEQALEHLQRARRRHSFSIDIIDIDTDAELKSRYHECVPVITVNGKERFRGAVNPVLLARLLKAEA